jgi:hypothetical protein
VNNLILAVINLSLLLVEITASTSSSSCRTVGQSEVSGTTRQEKKTKRKIFSASLQKNSKKKRKKRRSILISRPIVCVCFVPVCLCVCICVCAIFPLRWFSSSMIGLH